MSDSRFEGIGSGVTLYVALGPAIDFQVSVDGGPQSQFHFDGACLSSCGWRYNFSAYDVQGLQFGNHNVEFTLLDATALNASSTGTTTIWFDRAVVNEASSRTPPPRPSQPAPSQQVYPKSHPNPTRHPSFNLLSRLTPRQWRTARLHSSCGSATSTCRRWTSCALWPY